MSAQKLRCGFIPLFILIAIGVVILGAGGVYVVRNEFITKGKTGKAALDEKKINQQITNPSQLSSPSPEPEQVLAPQTFNYSPSTKTNPADQTLDSKQPSFTINPPAGWRKIDDPQAIALFQSPEKDEEPAEPPLIYRMPANIQIYIKKMPKPISLEEISSAFVKEQQDKYPNFQIIKTGNTTLGGNDAKVFEGKVQLKEGQTEHNIEYYAIKGNYFILISSHALDSAWSKRIGAIQASINSFKFTDE